MSSTGSKSSFLLVEKHKLQCIFQPLKSNRIKYTCFEVSHNLLILGATSGGLYLFRRDPCIFLQLIPNKEGPVNNIALSFDEKLIAFSSLKGVTCVLEIQGGESRIINRSLEHAGSVITSLVWSKETNKLYFGDDIGRISVINVSMFLNKNIFNIPAYMFMKLDSAIVQISCYEEYLLISTKTRCYLCDTTKEQYKQIGNQLREGFYGATFIKYVNGFKIYCARPGSRLWEVDDSGNVISTHQFKRALAIQSSAVVKLEENELILKTRHCWPDQSFNFCSLLNFLDRYLLTFKSDGIYVFDPTTAEVILWSDYYKDIVMVKSVHDIIYLWNSHGQVYSIVVTPLSKCLIRLYFSAKYQLCIDVLEKFLDQAMSDNVILKVGCLVGLKEQFPDIYKNSKVYGYIEKLISGTKHKQLSSNLDSGIFLIDNKHWKKWKIGVKNNKPSRKKKINRSHSMSDIHQMRANNVNSNKKFNYASLPDIQFSLNCNLCPKLQSCPDNFVLNCNSYLSSSFMHQIPFLSLTSPDIIQSTIVELGHNVKRKLFNTTKSLQNKLHLIEGKIKFHKSYIDSEILDLDLKHYNNGINDENIVFPNMDGNIVYNQPHNENSNLSVFETNEISQICEKVNFSFNEDETFILFNLLAQKLFEHNQSLASNESTKKSFPFKQVLLEKDIEIIRSLFCKSLQSGWIIKYIDHFKSYNDKYLDWPDHPLIFQEIHKTEDLINDIIMSNIILMFSELLDPYSILQCLENLKLACIFFSCSIVLDIFQETSFNFFASKKDSLAFSYPDSPLPYLLNMLFLMLRLDQIESACHIANKGNLRLHYISHLIIKLSMHLEFTGINHQNCIERCNKLFLNFLMKLNDNKLSLVGMYEKETLHHIECAFFSVNKHLLPKCSCNYPLIGGVKYSVKCPKIGELLLKKNLCFFQIVKPPESYKNNLYNLRKQTFKNSFYEEDSLSSVYLSDKELPGSSAKNYFCIKNLITDKPDGTKEHVIYSKIITLLQTMPELIALIIYYNLKNIDLCLPFIIQFGKINLLERIIQRGSYEFWNNAFDLNLKLSNGFCCICQRNSDIAIEVDWNQLSILTLRSLGATDTIKLMKSYANEIPSNGIDISFYRACFLSDIIKRKNEDVSALIDVYCNQPNFTASRILDEETAIKRSADILRSTVNTAPHTVTVDFKTELCCYCSLPLTSDKVKLQGKIRLFKCDHIYHISCLKHIKCYFECPLCK